MSSRSSAASGDTLRVAVLVMISEGTTTLCPFFGKCDGVLVIDHAHKTREFYPNAERKSESLSDLIVKSGADQLVCGFISEAGKRQLRAAGIDVRLGTCTRSVEELAAGACDLPEA